MNLLYCMGDELDILKFHLGYINLMLNQENFSMINEIKKELKEKMIMIYNRGRYTQTTMSHRYFFTYEFF